MYKSRKSRKSDHHEFDQRKGRTLQKKNNGLPASLKAGVENLSGYSMDDVKVHYNSSKPAQLNAHAYAQGAEIHVAPGQEKHLPHEAWHVVQQKQGRVKPTKQVGGVDVNDNVQLEKEADVMGAKASRMNDSNISITEVKVEAPVQRVAQLIEYSEAIIGNIYYVEGQNRKLIGKGYGWLKFEGLSGSYRASQVQDAVNTTNNTSNSGTSMNNSSSNSSAMVTNNSNTSNTNSSSYHDHYSNLRDVYGNWTPNETFGQNQTPFGEVNTKHNRKAPYITTNVKQYPKTKVKVDYEDIIRALRKQKISDKEIANILLEAEDGKLTNPNAIRAAAMLVAVVYLAEEWRKQGAVKIFRAILRLIAEGKYTLNDIPKMFDFVASAQSGREQVYRLWQIFKGKLSYEILSQYDQDIIGGMSPLREYDMDSEDDMRDEKEADFKNGRNWKKYGKPKRSETLDYGNIYQVNGTFFNIAHPRIGHNGHCAWDTLMYFGVHQNDLRSAANALNLTYNDFLDINELTQLVNYLNNSLNYDLKIKLTVFGYDGKFNKAEVIGNGSKEFSMGLVYDQLNGLGHYIPAINY